MSSFQYQKHGTTLIEAMVVILIVSMGIIGTYAILFSGQRLATTTLHRIQAINYAREGLEAMMNIRDTNRLQFGVDLPDCWNTYNYDASCIGSSGHNIPDGNYVLLNGGTGWTLSNNLSHTGIYLDSNSLPTQTVIGATQCNAIVQSNCQTIFSRQIHIKNTPAVNPTSMDIDSTVTWLDGSAKQTSSQVSLSVTLTNWQKSF